MRLCDNRATQQFNSVAHYCGISKRNWPEMNRSMKCLTTVGLLIGAVSTASAQTYWQYGDYDLRARGYYGTPYGGGPQFGSGGGNQYGYGPPPIAMPVRRRAGITGVISEPGPVFLGAGVFGERNAVGRGFPD
jgi:hypothetical protein